MASNWSVKSEQVSKKVTWISALANDFDLKMF